MARASIKTTRKVTVTKSKGRIKVKPKGGKTNSSGKSRGNPNHCPVCGKFM